LEELGLAGVVVWAGALAGGGVEVGLAGVVVWAGALAGVGLGMACPTVILMADMDLATPAMVMVQHRPMGTTHGKGI
jgi:hypothetical protein